MMMTSSNHAAGVGARARAKPTKALCADAKPAAGVKRHKTNACFGVTQAHQRLTASDEDKTLCLTAYHSKSTTIVESLVVVAT